MKYFLVLILSSLCFKTFAQKQDTVRWFVGHWIDKKTFKVDSTIYGKGGGGTLTLKPDGSLDYNSTAEKNFEDHISQSLTKIDNVEKEIVTANKQEEGMYQFKLVDETVRELEKVKKDIKGYENADDLKQPPAKNQKVEQYEKNCEAIAGEYHRLINFYKAHKDEKDPHFDLPAPPEADYFNCWSCDSTKQIEFDTLSARYVRNFFNEESKALSVLIGIQNIMDASGIGSLQMNVDEDVKEAFDSTKSHKGSCSYINYIELNKAIHFYLRRGMQKVKQLRSDNLYNYGASKPVLLITLQSYQMQWAMAGTSVEEMTGEMANFAKPFERLYDTLADMLIVKHDYRLIGTIPFMIAVYQAVISFATRGTLNGELLYSDDYRPKYSIDQLIGFPHFELTIDLDTKIGEKGNYTIAHIKSKSDLIVELDDKECIKFTLAKKEQEKIKANVITNEAIADGPHGVYVGTKTYTSQSPTFKIRFCEMPGQPTGDSLYLATFVPLAPDKGNWNVQGKMAPLGINSADRLFINIEELKNEAENIKPEFDQKQLEEIKKNSLALAEKMKAMQANGNADPAKMAAMVKEMMNNSGAITQTQTATLMRIKLPLKINNLDKMLVNQRFDAKEINPAIAQPIVYAYLTIKLEHKPKSGGDE